MFPEDKSRVLDELRARHGPVAMVGDGGNDAPGTADVVVTGEALNGLAHAVDLARRARTIVRRNLVFAASAMVVVVILALSGKISLTAGVIGREGSTVVIASHGLRLMRDRRPSARPTRPGTAVGTRPPG